MKEYRAEMLQKGHWLLAQIPFVGFCPIYRDRAGVEAWLEKCRSKWDHIGEVKKGYEVNRPTAYRIISREVTRWTPEEG